MNYLKKKKNKRIQYYQGDLKLNKESAEQIKNTKSETELKLLQVHFIQQQKFIKETDIDMTNCKWNQHAQGIAVNLIQQWKKEWQAAEERTKAKFTQKRKMVQRKMELWI